MPIDEQQVKALVRAALLRELGGGQPPQTSAPANDRRALVTAEDIEQTPEGGAFRLPPDAIVTPLARQTAMLRRVRLVTGDQPLPDYPDPQDTRPPVVALGADHGGYPLKEALKSHVQSLGYGVLDLGTDSTDSVDYPDFAHAVAHAVQSGEAWRGILIDGAGIGSAMAANKVPGIRAALCYDQATAINSREHNDANVLTLGAGLIGQSLARQIVSVWLQTEFGGGRHARRVNKIMQIERRYLGRGRNGE